MSLIQRRRRKNNSQSSLNPDAARLVVPRPRPFSDISNDSNQDSSISPPLTPPLVGAKPPVSTMQVTIRMRAQFRLSGMTIFIRSRAKTYE